MFRIKYEMQDQYHGALFDQSGKVSMKYKASKYSQVLIVYIFHEECSRSFFFLRFN